MQDSYLKALGIMQWVERDFIAPTLPEIISDPHVQPIVVAPRPSSIKSVSLQNMSSTEDFSSSRLMVDDIMKADQNALDKWAQLKNSIQHCQGCGCAERRIHAVFGKGSAVTNLQILPKIVFVLASPTREEDLQGDILVGKKQLIFNQLLDALKIPKTSVFVTHAIKCKSDSIRTHLEACSPYLSAQITFLDPQIIVLMGIESISAIALTEYLNQIDRPIRFIHTISLDSIEFNPLLKKNLWNDLKSLKNVN